MSGKPQYRFTKEFLEKEYQTKNTTQIALENGCAVNTINAWLCRLGIPLKKPGGWHNIVDLTGQKFGRWLVVKQMPPRRKMSMWLCRCECGNERIIHCGALRSGKSTQCIGCYGRSRRSPDELKNTVWGHIKKGAVDRKLEFAVTREECYGLFVKQGRICALTGLPLRFADTIRQHHKGGTTASLDRKDSSRGYLPDNVQWVHKDVNRMKSDLDESYFRSLCALVVDHSKICNGVIADNQLRV